MPNFEGNRGTKTILGNREHKKTNFRFLGNRGTSLFISGEQGKRWYPPPPPPGRASLMEDQARGGGGTLYQLGAWDWLKMMAFTWLR